MFYITQGFLVKGTVIDFSYFHIEELVSIFTELCSRVVEKFKTKI